MRASVVLHSFTKYLLWHLLIVAKLGMLDKVNFFPSMAQGGDPITHCSNI